MKKNRLIATIWITFICLIIIAMIAYIIYANQNSPYTSIDSLYFNLTSGGLSKWFSKKLKNKK